MGLVAPRHVGSSQTRAWTHVPCIGRQILNHCATREALFPFFCLIALARTTRTILIKVVSGQTFLIHDLKRKKFQLFTVEYNVSCGLLIYDLYCVEVHFLYTQFVESCVFFFFLIMKGCWILSNACTFIYWDDHWFLSLILLMWCITIVSHWLICRCWTFLASLK